MKLILPLASGTPSAAAVSAFKADDDGVFGDNGANAETDPVAASTASVDAKNVFMIGCFLDELQW